MSNNHDQLLHQFRGDGYFLREKLLASDDLDPLIVDIESGIEDTLTNKRLSAEITTTPSSKFEKRLYWLENQIEDGFLVRQSVTGKPKDAFRFRTPSLRNIARTPPYMHDGSQKTLEDVVTFYYRGVPATIPGNLPLDVEPLLDNSFSEISDIVALLESLSSAPLKITPPQLP